MSSIGATNNLNLYEYKLDIKLYIQNYIRILPAALLVYIGIMCHISPKNVV